MKKLVIILIASGFIACQPGKKKDQTANSSGSVSGTLPDTLTFHYDSVKVYSKNLVSTTMQPADTTKATVVFPVFKDQEINDLLQSTVLTPDEPAYKTYKELAAGFINKFDAYKKGNKDDQRAWFKEIKIQVLPQRSNYLGLKYTAVDYAGGAHPNSSQIYQNYDPADHHIVILESLLKPDSMPKLTAIGEKIFRKNEKLAPNASLADAYFFDKNVFVLNQNFTITNEGLKFLYNPYEIKPYASGITELVIPFEAIKEILKPNPVLPALK